MVGKVTTDAPGPGAYNIASSLAVSPNLGAGFTRAKRDPLSGKADAPGPGAYDPNASIGLRASPQAFISGHHAYPGPKDSALPGPGSYSLPDTLSQSVGRGFARAQRQGLHNKFEAPGPGSYSPSYPGLKTSPKAPITGHHAYPSASTSSPGPGSYDIKSSLHVCTGPGCHCRGRSFSKGPRGASLGTRDSPGPGQYDTVSKDGKPGVSMKGKYGTKRPDDNAFIPGPYTQFGY